MKYKITRRDFLNGVAIGAGAGFLNPIGFSAQAPMATPLRKSRRVILYFIGLPLLPFSCLFMAFHALLRERLSHPPYF